MTSLASHRDQILSDPEARAEYERFGPIFAVVGEMLDARQSAGLTQAELARRMGTSQSVIARLESARHMPTFNLICRYGQTLDRRIEFHLAPLGTDRSPQHA